MTNNLILIAIFSLLVACGNHEAQTTNESVPDPKSLGFEKIKSFSLIFENWLETDVLSIELDDLDLKSAWYREDTDGVQVLIEGKNMKVLESFLYSLGYVDFSEKKSNYRNYINRKKSSSAQLSYKVPYTHLIVLFHRD